jgi:PhoD-like phosphatase
MSPLPPRLTRRRMLVAGGVVVGAAALAGERLGSAGAVKPELGSFAHVYAAGFPASPSGGWGDEWSPLHYEGRLSADGGSARFHVPDGLPGAAKHQPMPVQLLDHECGDCEQLATFTADDTTLRPGLMAAGRGPFEFLAVTAEDGRLVLARYGREGRDVLERAPASPLSPGAAVHVRLARAGGRVRARMWPAGTGEPDWQIDAAAAAEGATPGIVVVQPESRLASTLAVAGYALGSPTAFRPTPPATVMTLSGIPAAAGKDRFTTAARVWSAYPARVEFEWSTDPAFAQARSTTAGDLTGPPYTARTTLPLPAGERLHWRARLTSPAGETAVTEAHEVSLPAPGGPLVLLAASCVQVMGPPPNDGYRRLLEAAPKPPAALVFQGDLGYANNQTDAAYAEAADYFADRFGRFLADPQFAELRRQVPTGFTIDDHDYGPENNADRTNVAQWAIALWNRIHADPSTRGYFDFRLGDVHCLTLDGRRYSDPVHDPDTPEKTKLGREQLAWMRGVLEESDAALFVVFSADSFAHRENPRHPELEGARLDCFAGGWPAEYRRVMTLFMDQQLRGRRVVVLSGDAHGLRIHYHPDPGTRFGAAGLSIVEFICSGLRPLLWSGPVPTDPTLDTRRNVTGHPGAGLMEIDPPGAAGRSIVLRAVNAVRSEPLDAFPPLRIGFRPGDDPAAATS